MQDQLSLNAGLNIAECSKESILQYISPSLGYKLLLLRLFLSGRFTQVLLYNVHEQVHEIELLIAKAQATLRITTCTRKKEKIL